MNIKMEDTGRKPQMLKNKEPMPKDKESRFVPFQGESQNPFAPEWKFGLIEQETKIDCVKLKEFLLSKEEEVLNNKLDDYSDGATGLGPKSTTSRFKTYNVFNWDNPEIDKLRLEIWKLYVNYYEIYTGQNLGVSDVINGLSIGCWMNIMRKGERIKIHQHGYYTNGFISGHFCVSSNDTKTVYVNPYERQEEHFLLKEAETIDEDKMIYHGGFNYTTNHPSEKMYVSKNTVGKLTLFPNFVPHFTTKHKADDIRITLAFELKARYDNYVPLFGGKQLIKYDDVTKNWIKNDKL